MQFVCVTYIVSTEQHYFRWVMATEQPAFICIMNSRQITMINPTTTWPHI